MFRLSAFADEISPNPEEQIAVLKQCGAAPSTWQPLGATVNLTGVGFWNPVKTTAGALKNGAELRPLLSVKITQGCGIF